MKKPRRNTFVDVDMLKLHSYLDKLEKYVEFLESNLATYEVQSEPPPRVKTPPPSR